MLDRFSSCQPMRVAASRAESIRKTGLIWIFVYTLLFEILFGPKDYYTTEVAAVANSNGALPCMRKDRKRKMVVADPLGSQSV